MLSLFKTKPPQSEVLKQRLVDAESKLPAAETEKQRAAYGAETSGDEASYFAAVSTVNHLVASIDRLRSAIPAAIEAEAIETEAARSEQERQEAEAKAAARKASYRGAQTDLSNCRRAMEPVPAACAVLAEAMAKAVKSASSFDAKIPPDCPRDDVFNQFGPSMISDLIAGELARAGAAVGVDLPGGSQVPDTKFETELKGKSDHLVDYARRVIIDRERKEERPVISEGQPVEKKQPAGLPVRRRIEIERLDRIQRGLDPDGPDENLAWQFPVRQQPAQPDDINHTHYRSPAAGLIPVPSAAVEPPATNTALPGADDFDAAAEMRAQSAMLRGEAPHEIFEMQRARRELATPPEQLVTEHLEAVAAADMPADDPSARSSVDEADASPALVATAPSDIDPE